MKIKSSRLFHALACLAIAGSASAETYLAGGPYAPDTRTVVLFHFDEAAGASRPQDSSLHDHDPYAGPLATGDAGVFGNAMAFTNSLIEIAHDASFLNVQSNGFFECWIKPSRITSIAGEATTRSSIKTREAATAATSASASA